MSLPKDALVQIKTYLDAEQWFKLCDGVCASYRDSMAHTYKIVVTLEYRGKKMHLSVQQAFSRNGDDVLRVTVEEIARRSRMKKTINATIKHIQEICEEHFDKVDACWEQVEKERIEKERQLEEQRTIVNSFKNHAVGSNTGNKLSFGVSRKFNVQFNYYLEDDGTPKYRVDYLIGYFTKEEMEKLLTWLGSCPSAVADRVLNGR